MKYSFKTSNYVMKGEEAAVDKTEWTEIREMVGMKPELDEFSDGK